MRGLTWSELLPHAHHIPALAPNTFTSPLLPSSHRPPSRAVSRQTTMLPPLGLCSGCALGLDGSSSGDLASSLLPCPTVRCCLHSSSPRVDCKPLEVRKAHFGHLNTLPAYSWCSIRAAAVAGLQTSCAESCSPTCVQVLCLDLAKPRLSPPNHQNSSSFQTISLT